MLLAVSGGVDSMVMLDLFHRMGSSIAVAHCNFQLRGEDSERDEALVLTFCQKRKIPFFNRSFSTREYAHDQGISTQMAARELRYTWFEELRKEHRLDYVATAHHLDDAIETFFLNLSRGTSLKGLRGIATKNDRIIRPLLGFCKEELVHYASDKKIEWREDASNQSTDYQRNLVRKEIIPLFEKMNPDFSTVMQTNLEKLAARYDTSEKHYERLREILIEKDGEGFSIEKKQLFSDIHSAYDLYELLRHFQFNYKTCKQIFGGLETIGAIHESDHYQVNIDRELILIVPKNKHWDKPMEITLSDDRISLQGQSYELMVRDVKGWDLTKNKRYGAFDLSKLNFPLSLRTWQQGDRFQPLGMKGSKLVSDLLIDEKIPRSKKAEVRVLLSGEEIVWVIGIRLSEKFKVTAQTEKVYEIIPI